MEPVVWQKIWPYRLPILFFGIGLILLIITGFLFYWESSKGQSIEISQTPSDQSITTIKIDVEGAVEKPGVYELTKDSRIKDSLVAAGGLSADADREYVAKNINLAQKLIDGTKIYIPQKNENLINLSNSGNASTLINLNLASASELDKLSGVGPTTAQKIIAGRPYQSVDELLSKKIVGKSVFEKIKDQITIY